MTMSARRAAAPSLGSQVHELTSQATGDMVQRSKKREADAAAALKAPLWSRRRLSLIALCASLPVLAVLVAATFFGDSLAEAFSPAPSAQVARDQAQADLDLAVREIEAFRADFSALPQTLVQIGAPAGGDWTYTKDANDQYQVVRALRGQVVAFSSVSQEVAADGR